ncbi:hypothetical protein [Streptomyces flavidovirens]|uniref:Carboxypeptidase regulatory-like domain-containing protein n=1 Tax=Streptomyces flavidovirens TaxID=67298 RepID=A0ABW6RG66_9ACTN
MRKITAAVATALAVSASTLVAAPAAQAADVNLKVQTWSWERDGAIHAAYETHDYGVHPKDVTIRVREKGSDKVLTTLDLNDTDECASAYDCWGWSFVTDPVTLPEMGVYTMDVVVREGLPDERVDRDNGEFNYGLYPQLTATTERPWISYDNHRFDVSGTLVATDPNTREVKPFVGASVHYRGPISGNQGEYPVDEAGRFRVPVAFSEYSNDTLLDFSFGSAHKTLQLPFRQQELKLKLDTPVSAVTAPYGSDVPVRGKVARVADDGTEKPLAGANVTVGLQAAAPTRDDGTFAGLLAVMRAGTVDVAVDHSRWFKNPPPHSLRVSSAPKTNTFSPLTASVDKYRKVTFTGKLGVTEGSYPAGTTAKISIQHSTDGRSWSSVGSFTARYGTTFTQSPSKKGTAGSYWRLRHSAAALNSTSFKLGRKATQLLNDDVTPEGVRKGTTITAKGSLIQESGTSWKSFAGQTVRIYFKASTSGATWQQLGTAKTLDNGTFSKKFTAQQDGTWQMRYVDTVKTHYADYGREDFVDVR